MAASSASTPVTTSATTTTTTTDAAHGDASSAAGASSDTATEPPLALAAAAALPAPPPPLPPPPLPPSSAPLPPPPPTPQSASASAAAEGPSAVYSVAVPSETHFASREELLSYVHEFTVSHGYAVVIQKSNVPRGQVWLRCDLGGSYRNTLNLSSDSRKRKCSSRLKNCPFQLYARRLPDARWLLKVQNASHNHDVAADTEQLVAHPVARRLTLEQKKLVDELTEMGARPALIVEKMKQKFPDKPIKVQDIYNTRNFIRRERSAGRDPFPEAVDQEGEDEDEDKDASKSSVVVAVGAPSQLSQQRGSGGGDGAEVEEQTVIPHAPVLPSRLPPCSADSESLQPAALVVPTSAPPATQAAPLEPQENNHSSDKKDATSAAHDARLQELLRDASDSFSTFQTRTQKQFLFQLELLLEKSKKGSNSVLSSSSSSAAKKSPRLGRAARTQQQKHQQTSAESTDSNSSSDGSGKSLPPGGAHPPAAPGNSIASASSALL